jgi:hypothetical protein
MALEIYIKQPGLEITIKGDGEDIEAAISVAKQLVPTAATDLIGTTVVTAETPSPTLDSIVAYYKNNGHPDLDLSEYKSARRFVISNSALVSTMPFEEFRTLIRKVESLGHWGALHAKSLETYYSLARRLGIPEESPASVPKALEDIEVSSCNELVVRDPSVVTQFKNLGDWSRFFRGVEEKLSLKPLTEVSLKTYYNKAKRLQAEASNA